MRTSNRRRGIVKRNDPVVNPSTEPKREYATTQKHRDWQKAYAAKNKAENNELWQRRLESSRRSYRRNKKREITRRRNYSQKHRIQENERKKAWAKKSGHYQRLHAKRGEFQNKAYKESGYRHIMQYLWYRGMKSPLNFAISYKHKTWSWTMPHP